MIGNFKIVLIIIIAVIGIAFYSGQKEESSITDLTDFGKCLSQNDFKYYGAYWCSACAKQSKILGKAKKYLYTECAIPGSKSQTQECSQIDIRMYPTWIINDEEKIEGIQSLKSLSKLSGCSV